MKIRWFGQACFELSSGSDKVIIDPYSPQIGITLPNGLAAQAVCESHQHLDHNFAEAIAGQPEVISDGQARQVGVWQISAADSFHDDQSGLNRGKNLIFILKAEGLTFCHLGDLGHLLSDEQVKEIGLVDILAVPVGGFYTIDAKLAVLVIEQLKPKIVLPMHYSPDNAAPNKLAKINDFLESADLATKRQSQLEITQNGLPQETEIIVLERAQSA